MHHDYLRRVFPLLKEQLSEFVANHKNRFPELPDLEAKVDTLQGRMMGQLSEEEEIIFPYIRQLENAYKDKDKDKYGVLFVRAMRKPLDAFLKKAQDWLPAQLIDIRKITNNYICPPNACIKHRVVFGLLQELDNDIQQHFYLENDILLPRAIEMQRELLS
jgi:regulator of cell morphogenesis and NO signaling